MSRQAFARILVFCIVASALTPSADAQTTGIREVSASPRSLIPLQTRLRFTTMIVLPEGEEILDVICGDRDFWVISATHNIAHVKPAKEGAATNLNESSLDRGADRNTDQTNDREGGGADALRTGAARSAHDTQGWCKGRANVIPSGAPEARRRGIAILPVEGQAPRWGRVRFLASAATRLRSE